PPAPLPSAASSAPSPARAPEAVAPPPARREIVQTAQALAPATLPQDLSEVIALASAHKEPLLRINLERYARIVRFEPGRIELNLAPGAPRTLGSEMSEKLTRWTGTRWIVAILSHGGAPTMREAAEARDKAEHDRVKSNPLVAAIFEAYPKARILDIRRPSDLATEGMAEPSEESDE
ncbi:MAG: hypothetical protein HXY22_05860, partial [Alphaproteobacteria bacterium]|nr:hypothetical protein [Alphaproteobacteria bacterium]